MRNTFRMQQVQAPVIPIIGDWVRSRPGAISLGQGVVHYGPPKEAIEQYNRFLENPENHKYHAVEGIPILYDAIRDKLQNENGIIIESHKNRQAGESVLCVTAGGNMAFMNAVLAITDPGDEIILLTPYYFNHEMAVRIAGAIPIAVPTDENFQPDLPALRQAITSKTRAIVTVSPNNPSGAVYPESTLRAINELCRERGLYHINDEAYEYFTYEEAVHFSPASIEHSAGHTVSLFSLSKSYGFAGWRIGYMVYPVHLDESVKKIQDTILICPPLVSQYAACGALSVGSSYCLERLPEKAGVRSIMLEELDSIREICRTARTQGAFYLLVRMEADLDEMQLIERLIRDFGVAVMPGRSFGLTGGCFFRVSYGSLQKETAVEGMRRLVAGLKTIAGAYNS
ncbi:MAG: pyridoxal phosphate-dependent aminotransferase [Candidatus Omnitrophica bacterium]|nr:pyridoxal phosphate-dependent aminotransferase [Candidatus Omnitrophota bacterium]